VGSTKMSYAGIAAAVAGVVALLGVYSDWWQTSDVVYAGTADISGSLALAMAIATFAFGVAYVLMSDPRIRRALGALLILCAVILVLGCVWGFTRGDEVAPGATVAMGLYVSTLGGVVGLGAGILAIRDVTIPESELPEALE
jgi:hypothetical protein